MSSPRTTVRVIAKAIRGITGGWVRPKYADPITFIEAIYDVTLDAWQRQYLQRGPEASRVAIVASRQSGKSTVVAGFVCWLAVYFANAMIVVTSKTERQARYFLRKVRHGISRIIPSSQVKSNSKSEIELGNGSVIAALPCRDVETVRGYSPQLIVLDEAAYAPEELLPAITPSLAATQGALHMISSPNGPQGFFWRAVEGDQAKFYESQRITADMCPRISKKYLEEQKVLLGDIFYEQEFFCKFLSPIGSFFTHDSLSSLFDSAEDPLYSELDEDYDPLDDLYVDINRDDVRAALDSRDRIQRLMFGE